MTRPRGFIDDWSPKPDTMALIVCVQNIINGSTILPLTLRQIFYMLVSNHGYDKTEKAYKRMCEVMNKARRARLIDMDAIRDDGLTRQSSAGYSSRQQFIDSTLAWVHDFTLDRQKDQVEKVYVWCEAGGMVPQLANAAQRYHVPVLSSGGFDSVTTKHNFAQEISYADGPVVILHLGDHDPSGVHMFGSLDEDLQAFVFDMGGEVTMERIAVTPDQVDAMGLPTAPPKATDRRAFSGQTTQCEAIPPEDLRLIVMEAIERHIDMQVWEETLVEEREITEELTAKFADLE